MGKNFNVPSIYVILRDKDTDKLAFLLRTHTGYKDGTYTLPAGHVEHGESNRIAAAREALEEVGVRIALDGLHHVYTLQRNEAANEDIRIDIFFEASKWDGEVKNMEPHKHGDVAWFTVEEMPDTIMDYQAEVLRAIANGDTYHERGW